MARCAGPGHWCDGRSACRTNDQYLVGGSREAFAHLPSCSYRCGVGDYCAVSARRARRQRSTCSGSIEFGAHGLLLASNRRRNSACSSGAIAASGFAWDCGDQEALSWVAATRAQTDAIVRDAMPAAVQHRFGQALPVNPIEWLPDGAARPLQPGAGFRGLQRAPCRWCLDLALASLGQVVRDWRHGCKHRSPHATRPGRPGRAECPMLPHL